MGANIPLPALAVQPPQQQQGPLDQYAKVLQLKSMQNQAQLQPILLQSAQEELKQRQLQTFTGQQQLKDQQAYAAAFKQWDPSQPDALPGLLAKNGASGQAVNAAYSQSLARKKDLSEVAKNDAVTGSTNFETQAKKTDLLLGHINMISGLPNEQLNQGFLQTAQAAIGDGTLDQQHAQMAQQLAQLPPDQLRQKLDIFKKSLMGQQAQNDEIAKQYGLRTAAANATEAEANAAVAQQKATLGLQQQQTEINKNKAQTAEAGATTAKTQLETQFLRNGPEALQTVPPNLRTAATADATKAGLAYSGAKQAADNLAQFMQEARSGNKAAIKVIPLQGALEIVTAQGIHRINRTEVDSLGPQVGSAYDKIAGKLGGAISGKDITDSVLNDMEAMQGAIAQGARQKYQNDLNVINQNYHATFKPANFDGGGGITVTDRGASFIPSEIRPAPITSRGSHIFNEHISD